MLVIKRQCVAGCRLLGLSLAAGRLWEAPCGGLADAGAAGEALMARLLEQLTPSTTPLQWMLLRLLLDQQARGPPPQAFLLVTNVSGGT